MPNIDARRLLQLLAEAGFHGRVLIVSGEDERVLRETQAWAQSLGLSVPYVQ
jgi:hypothetical protein